MDTKENKESVEALIKVRNLLLDANDYLEIAAKLVEHHDLSVGGLRKRLVRLAEQVVEETDNIHYMVEDSQEG